MDELFWSLTHRPYILVFLLAFLALSWLEQGSLRTLIWLVSGYLIALAAEWTSINYGHPFGWYQYHYDTLQNDLVVAGVPFFDSLSFVFLSYVSFSFAQFFLSPLWAEGRDLQRCSSRRVRNSTGVLLLGAVLMVVVDLIVDPVASLGRHWYLGDIYHYLEPGPHFGVPLQNYFGWFLVAWVTIFVNQKLDGLLAGKKGRPVRLRHAHLKGLYAPLFWTGILAFQLGVTYWLGWNDDPDLDHAQVQTQAIAGTFIVAPIVLLAALQVFKHSNRARAEEIELWLRDFPCPKLASRLVLEPDPSTDSSG